MAHLVKFRDSDDTRFVTVNLDQVVVVEPAFGGRSSRKVVGSELTLVGGLVVTVLESPAAVRRHSSCKSAESDSSEG